MDTARQAYEVDRNYDAIVRNLASLLADHLDGYALMRDAEIVDLYRKPGDANRAGVERFPDENFSIQEIIDEPIDLGFWSHVGPARVAARR